MLVCRAVPGKQRHVFGATAPLARPVGCADGHSRLAHSAMHIPPDGDGRAAARPCLRRDLPLPGPLVADPARRSRIRPPGLQRLHRPTGVPTRRGLSPQTLSASAVLPKMALSARWLGSASEGVGKAACKPSSVPPRQERRRSSIFDGGCPPPPAADPRAWRRRLLRGRSPVTPSYLALLRVELARFTRAAEAERLVSVALVLASRRTGVTRYPASWSSDFPRAGFGFPRRGTQPSGRLADPSILPRTSTSA
jgi:hypothetical protein